MSANNIIELSLLILVLPLVSTKVDEPYICEQREQEADCQNMYQLTQCLDDHCSQNITFNFECCAVCDTLPTPGIYYTTVIIRIINNYDCMNCMFIHCFMDGRL